MVRPVIMVYLFVAMVLLTVFFVPKRKLEIIFPTALSVGLAAEILAILVFSKLFHWFSYVNLGRFGEEGFPVFILFGWIFLIALYLHFLPARHGFWPLVTYTVFFTTMTFFLHVFLENEMLKADYLKYFDVVTVVGNFMRFLLAYWVYQSGFFGFGRSED